MNLRPAGASGGGARGAPAGGSRPSPWRAALALALAEFSAATADDLPWPGAELPEVRVTAADVRAGALARQLGRDAAHRVEQVSLRLALPVPLRVDVLIASRAPRDADEAAALGLAHVPYWAAGIAEPRRARIVLFADRLDVVGHEGLDGALVHEAAHLVLGANVPEGADVPRWYDEGLAMVVERELSWRDAFELARMAVVGEPAPLEDLARTWPATGAGARSAYAASLSFVDYVQRAALPGAPRRLVEALHQGADFERAFVIAYGANVAGFEADWRRTLRDRYIAVPLLLLGTLANMAFGTLAVLVVLRARRRLRQRLEALEEDLPPHDAAAPPAPPDARL